MAATIPAVSTEYLHGLVSASVTLDEQVIEVAFVLAAANPDDSTSWIVSEWEGAPGLSRTWKLLIGPGSSVPLAVGQYGIWMRLHDSPEVPVRKHDILTVQ